MYKRAVRTLMDDFADVAEMSSQFVVEMFTACPHAIILDLAKQVSMSSISVVNDNLHLFLCEMLEAFIISTCM